MCESLEGDLVCDADGDPGEQPHAEDRCPCPCDHRGAEAQAKAEEGSHDDSVHAETGSDRSDQETEEESLEKSTCIARLFSAALSKSSGSITPESTIAATVPAMKLKLHKMTLLSSGTHPNDPGVAPTGRIERDRTASEMPMSHLKPGDVTT